MTTPLEPAMAEGRMMVVESEFVGLLLPSGDLFASRFRLRSLMFNRGVGGTMTPIS